MRKQYGGQDRIDREKCTISRRAIVRVDVARATTIGFIRRLRRDRQGAGKQFRQIGAALLQKMETANAVNTVNRRCNGSRVSGGYCYQILAGFSRHFKVAVSKGAERAARAVAVGLHIVTLGRLVDLRMELLLGAGVTVLARISIVAARRIAPFFAMLGIRTGR